MRSGAFSSIELNKVLRLTEEADKKYVTRIVYGVLDNSVKYDYIIKNLCKKKPKGSIVSLLKVGLYLLYEMNSVKDYAVIDNVVKIAKKVSKGALGGFTNGFLRSAVDYKLELPTEPNLRISVENSIPLQVVDMLISEYGEELAKEIISAKDTGLENVRVAKNNVSIEEFTRLLKENNIEFKPTILENAFKINYKKLMMSDIDKSFYTVQGMSSMLCCDALEVNEKDLVLDCCSAPGGKAIYLSEKAKAVVATDLHPHRVKLIGSYTERMKCENIEIDVMDATKFKAEFENKFTKIICDVPCSGVGVFGNKPDILLNFSVDKVENLTVLQKEILQNASKYLTANGEMIYSTCTVFQQENHQIVEDFLKQNSNFEELPIGEIKVPMVKKPYGVQLIPSEENPVGFYMARLKKKC